MRTTLVFLETIRDHINNISEQLSDFSTGNVDKKVEAAKNSVTSLRNAIQKWWEKNHEKAIQYSANIGLLGFGTAFLTVCGAPPAMATGISAVLGGSKPVIDYLKEAKESD